MINIKVKLFSDLMEYLPDDVDGNTLSISVDPSTSPYDVLAHFSIPKEKTRVMMVNGEFVPIEQRSEALSDGDTLTVWPSIQGG